MVTFRKVFIAMVLLAVLIIPQVTSTEPDISLNEYISSVHILKFKMDMLMEQSGEILNATRNMDGNITFQLSNIWIAIANINNRVDEIEKNLTVSESLSVGIETTDISNNQIYRLQDATRDISRRIGSINKQLSDNVATINGFSDRLNSVQHMVGNQSNETTIVIYNGINVNSVNCTNGTIMGGGVECDTQRMIYLSRPDGNGWYGDCWNPTIGRRYPDKIYAICLVQ